MNSDSTYTAQASVNFGFLRCGTSGAKRCYPGGIHNNSRSPKPLAFATGVPQASPDTRSMISALSNSAIAALI